MFTFSTVLSLVLSIAVIVSFIYTTFIHVPSSKAYEYVFAIASGALGVMVLGALINIASII